MFQQRMIEAEVQAIVYDFWHRVGQRADGIVRSMQHARGGEGQREAVGLIDVVPQEIGRVLLNLVGNAFDAVYEQQKALDESYAPTVTVSTQCVDGQVEIRVVDNGPGIPDDVRGKIFEPFFTTKPTGSGTGLGLSLSYDIVTQGHGGSLTVERSDGQGATFVVTLSAQSPGQGK